MEKILVCLKRVVDYNVRIRVRPDGSGVATEGLKMSINPFDEIAVEEALRIRERGEAREIIIVSIGPDDCQQQLRTGLAMGADRAILVQTADELEPLGAAAPSSSSSNANGPNWSCSASRRSTTTATRRDRCWQRCGIVRGDVRLRLRAERLRRDGHPGSRCRPRGHRGRPAGGGHHRSWLNEPYVKLPDIMKAKKRPSR